MFELVHEGDEGFPEGRSAASRPSLIVDVEGAAVCHPADSVQVSPRDDGVAGGISCSAGAEVDDSGELSAAGEKVVGGDVAVKSLRVRCPPC